MKLHRQVTGGAAALLAALSACAQAPVAGRYVRVEIPKEKATLSLAEVQVFSKGVNVALKHKATQSEDAYGGTADRAVDGNTNTSWGGGSITHTPENHANPWWEVDLGAEVAIDQLVIWNRVEEVKRLCDASVMIVGADRQVKWEQTITNPSPTSNPLAVDAAQKSAAVGRTVQRRIDPATDDEIRAAYEKRASWIETVLAAQAKLEAFRNLKPLTERLLQDFPEARQEIVDEFAGFSPLYHSKRLTSLAELAQHYVSHTPDPQRRAVADKAGQVKTVADLAEIRQAFRDGRSDELQLTALKRFNPEALARAIGAFAAKYPDVYKDKDALFARVEQVRLAVASAGGGADARHAAAQQVEALNEAVFLRHPAIDFKEILFVRRSTGSVHNGLPANWQGNSSIPLHGYINDVVRAPLKQGGKPPQVVCASGCFIGDVDLGFDADKILYSGGKPGERGWRVFETKLDAPGSAREVTPPDQPDVDFYDPCYLPDGRRLFVATSGYQGVPCVGGADYVGNLHSMDPDGTIRRLVFDQDNSWCPTALVNGRILYLRWEYTDSAHYFSRVLMSMNPDGTDQKAFYGSNSYWPNSLFYARPLPGSATKFVGIVGGHHGHARKGELVLFDASRGRHETSGAVQKIPGYGKPVPNVTADALVNGSKPLFLHPFPLSDELFLVSMEGDNGNFYIVLADIYDNLIPLWQSPFAHLYEPIPLKPQPRPPLPADRVVKGSKECTVYLVGAHLGEGLRGVPKGKVKAFRIYQYEYSPRNAGGHYDIGFEGPWDPRVILGTVDVEADGSCQFVAPANVPLAMQPLDESGRAMQLMRSWFVGMPGERVSCAGCHEEQNNSPASHATQAVLKKPQQIKPWYGPRRNFAFEREVQPVLDQSCVGCHNDKSSAKNALGQPVPSFENVRGDGGFSKAYLSLHPYVRRNGPEGDYHLLTPLEFHADTSELVQLLRKGHHGVQLSAEQWDRLIAWIDLNVPYWGSWTERTGGSKKDMLARRREMAIRYANDDFDPELITNPYKPAAFVAPPAAVAPAPAPAVAGWPFDEAAAKAKQGGGAAAEFDLGGGQKLKVVKVPAGAFAMGSNDETPAERPVCAAAVDKAFWMGATEVTMAQFQQFDPAFENGVYDKHYKDQVNRGYFVNDPDFPAVRVTWEQASAYCAWLSKKLGKPVRLPTEAQWEWACRAGSAAPLNYGDFNADFSKRENLADATFVEFAVTGVDPKPMENPPPLFDYELRDRRFNDGVLHLAKVGRYAPNAWGLYDMHGNAAEWTRSAYRPYPYSDADGRNNANVDERKVVRGGSWYRRQHRATSSWRWGYPGWMRPFDVGFRVVIEES
jgi:formylglycine-generating enzyme required for sulfatase activity